MLGLEFNNKDGQGIKILCLGAHCDDIEIGCGGTLSNMLGKYKNAEVHWVVLSSDSRREKEARSSANLFLRNAKIKNILVKKFRNGYFPYVGGEIKDYFEDLKNNFSPDVIFTHYRLDIHQDHRVTSDLTWNTFRNNFILEYEIPKFDGDFGSPNLFVPLKYPDCQRKVNKILKSFTSQSEKHWFTEELLLSTLRIRGMECCSSTNYAEAFYCRKISITIDE